MAISRKALFPGSFDPFTRGHLDVVTRALELFDEVTVASLVNPGKTGLFTSEERVEIARAALAEAGLERVETLAFDGLTVDLARQLGARWILRGLRSESDAADELPLAHSNRLLSTPPVETVFLATRPEVAFISSRLVRQIARGGGPLEAFVPPGVERAIRLKLTSDR